MSHTPYTSPVVPQGQQDGKDKASTNGPAPVKKPIDLKFKHESFTFVRIKYYSGYGRHSAWQIDFPDADLNFSARFQKETGLKTESDGRVITLTDTELKRYPFIYIVEATQ